MPAHFTGQGHCTTKEYLFEGKRYWVARSRRGFVTRAFQSEQSALNAAEDIDEYFDKIDGDNEEYQFDIVNLRKWFEDQKYLSHSELIRHLLGLLQPNNYASDEFAIWLVLIEEPQKGFVATNETNSSEPTFVDGQWSTLEEADYHASTLFSGRTPGL